MDPWPCRRCIETLLMEAPPDSTEEANDGGRLFMIVSGINQHSIDDEELNLDVSLSFSCLVLLDSLSRGFAKLCDD